MKLIPAIDLKNNKVVLATGEKRCNYQEIPTTLSPSSDPIDFIKYLSTLCNFNTIYIADLDSISKFSKKNILINSILDEYKNINFIIDNGATKMSHMNIYDKKNFKQIISTESFKEFNNLKLSGYENFILSADIAKGKIICKDSNYNNLHPKKVICMNLDNIGCNTGINENNIRLVKNLFPQAKIIISGGISDSEDIKKIKNMGYNEIILLTAILARKVKN